MARETSGRPTPGRRVMVAAAAALAAAAIVAAAVFAIVDAAGRTGRAEAPDAAASADAAAEGAAREAKPMAGKDMPCAREIFLHGKVHTLSAAGVVEAFGVAVGRFVAVGSSADVTKLACPDAKVHDLAGRTVIPGLIDSHAHLVSLGLADRWLDLRGAVSPQAVAKTVAKAARPGVLGDATGGGDDAAGGGGWILGRGWDQTLWPDGFPDRKLLDKVAGDRPVYLSRVDGHAAWVSTAALGLAGIDTSTSDPPAGRILRRPDGSPTGVLIDSAASMVGDLIQPPEFEERAAAVDRAIDRCLSRGVTMVHDAGADSVDVAVYREMIGDVPTAFPFRVYAMVCWDCADREKLLSAGPKGSGPKGSKGNKLWLRAAKIYADGALGSRGAALDAPYADDPSSSGLLNDEAALEKAIEDAVSRGFQPAVHAIGDRANRIVLDIYERLLEKHPGKEIRPRIEHAQVLSPADIARIGRIGVIAAMQPTHCTSDMRWATARLGEDLATGAYAWRSVLGSGATLAFGSDFPIESHDPFLGSEAALTRSDASGSPPGGWHPEQAVTLDQALHAYTMGAAHASFTEDLVGSIEPGKLADFVVLDRDLFSQDPGRIHEVEPLATYVGGFAAWESDEIMRESVEAASIDLDLAGSNVDAVLWDRFANSDVVARFDRLTARDWRAKWRSYGGALLDKAEAAGLDRASLARSLAAIEPAAGSEIALVPIASYLARNGGRKAWIVACKWEYEGPDPDGFLGSQMLVHVKIWAIDAKTGKILGHASCD